MKKFNYTRAISRNKADCNKEYKKLVSEYDLKQGNHLILDSRFKKTTKTLNSIKIPSRNIYVPNPYERVKTINWRNLTLGEFLEQEARSLSPFSSAYFDYCCTLEGNEEISPLEDIQYLIENNMIDGLLGVECCQRDPRKTRSIRNWEDMFKLINLVEELAIENDYIYEVINGWTYKGSMFIVWFYLRQK